MLTNRQSRKNNRQLFNDGEVVGILVEGPYIRKDLTREIPFGSKVIGAHRFYHAMGEKVTLSRMIVIPYDQSMIGIGKIYLTDFKTGHKQVCKVVQFQELVDSTPPAMQLSLEELTTQFEDKRDGS